VSLVSLDGTVMDASQAAIPVTDEGLLRGDGVFEVIRVYAGRPFALDQHLQRMARSAEGLRLDVDVAAVRSDIEALLEAGGEVEGVVRALVTRGGRRIALIEAIKQLPATVALASVTYAPTRILDGIKSLSYGGNMLATRLAQERGADEAVLVTPHGRVLEAPTRSIFAVIGDVLRTPPLTDHILDSITRRALLEVIDVEESPITIDELREAREAFLASTTHEVLPIHRVDDSELPDAPGPQTREAGARLSEHIVAALVAAA
jgi:branched-chain amino acid aminotransferase